MKINQFLSIFLFSCLAQTVSVFIYPTVGDFVQVDLHGQRYVLAGEYSVQFGVPETHELGQGWARALLQAI